MSGTVRDELEEKRRKLKEMREARKGGASRFGSASPGGSSSARDSASPPRLSTATSSSPKSLPEDSTLSAPRTASDILARTGAAAQKEGQRILPKPVNLAMQSPEKLKWSIAPAGRPDSYDKPAQTVHSGPVEKQGGEGEGEAALSPPRARARSMLAPPPPSSPQQQQQQDGQQQDKNGGFADELYPVPELTMQQKVEIVKSRAFQDFFKSSSFIVERALSDPDILPPGMVDAQETVLVRGQGEPLVRSQIFNDSQLSKKLTKNCPVTSIDFPNVGGSQEMFLASYFKRAEGQTTLVDVEGQVLIWSVRVPQRPFQTLTAPSDVAKAMYCKFKSNLVVGGLYNGQVCLWDTRAGADPVQVSPLTMDGHTHPVFGVDVVGSVNSHSLVTLSSDGKVCTWQLEKLNAPSETNVLQQMVDVGGTAVAKDIQATSMTFRDNESNRFYLGSENGMLLSGTRSAGGSSPEGFEGHTSPITSLHCHPLSPPGADDYSDFVLTSSMDWTCKLWQPSKSDKPIFSFDEYTDYVYEVKWSPVHPAVFASVDGSGILSVWNLVESLETPIGKVEAATSGKAACHLAWSSDGKSIVVGDAGGDITLWEVAGHESSPKAADWPLLGQKIAEINAV